MITVKEITSKPDINKFITFAWQIYKNDPNWVPPLIFDMQAMLDKQKSPFFEFGEAAYFMAYRDRRPVGRLTAHINPMHNQTHHTQDGFFGFYECLDDDEAARALLKAAEDWLRAKGMTKIIGQENFTIYDELGFMIKGWDANPATPVILNTYTPEYYVRQLANAGFRKEIDWIAFMIRDDFTLKDVHLKMKDRLIKRRGLTFRNIRLKNLKSEIEKIKVIVGDAWSENWGHFPLSDRWFDKIAEALKAISDERVLFIVEDGDKPVACSISLPDINPSIKKMNGRLFPFGWYHFLTAKQKAIGLRTFMMGVQKEYRNLGIDIALVVDTFRAGRQIGYSWSECSLIVETNTKMIEPLLKWGGTPYKIYRLFSKDL